MRGRHGRISSPRVRSCASSTATPSTPTPGAATTAASSRCRSDGGPWRGVNDPLHARRLQRPCHARHRQPLAGQRAFTGDSHGWSSARVDLSPFAGHWLKVRFRMASDRAMGGRGWYIDDIRIYTCADRRDRPTGALSHRRRGAQHGPAAGHPERSGTPTPPRPSPHLRVAGNAALDGSAATRSGDRDAHP